MQIYQNNPIYPYTKAFSSVGFQGKASAIPTERVVDKLNQKVPVRQIASEFGISLTTFYKLLRDREIPYNQQEIPKRLAHITKDVLEEMLNNGKTVPQICEHFKITQNIYYSLVERLGVVHPQKIAAARLASITEKEFLDCLNSGMSVDAICKKLNISSSGYYELISKFNIQTSAKKNIAHLATIKKEDIENLLNAGKSSSEIAAILKIPSSALTSLISRYGIVTKNIQSRQQISQISKEKLQELVSSEKSVNEICELLKIPVRTYSRLVKLFEIKTKRQMAKEHLASISRESLQRLVDDGFSVKEICKILKINSATFYILLKRLKIDYKYTHHYNEIVIPESVLQKKAQSGESTKEISASLGIAVNTYHKKAKTAGVKTVLRDSLDKLASISKEQFQAAVNRFKSIEAVCDSLNITRANYFALMHKYNVTTDARRSMDLIGKVNAAQILEMRASGKSVKDICYELNISKSSYNRIMRKSKNS